MIHAPVIFCFAVNINAPQRDKTIHSFHRLLFSVRFINDPVSLKVSQWAMSYVFWIDPTALNLRKQSGIFSFVFVFFLLGQIENVFVYRCFNINDSIKIELK